MKELVTEGSEQNQALLEEFNRFIPALKELRDKNITVLYRPFHEMNGRHFWWGARSKADFKNLWRYTHNYFTNTHNLNNLLWVFGPVRSPHYDVTDYYPGDNYVDIIGSSLYTSKCDGSTPPRYDWINWDRNYAEFLQLSKPIVMSELGTFAHPDTCRTDNTRIINLIKKYPLVSYWVSFGYNYGLLAHDNPDTTTDDPFNDPWVMTLDEFDRPNPSPSSCMFDINQDGIVDIKDHRLLIPNYSLSQSDADINKDNQVNIFDHSLLASQPFQACN
jgi:beta-mannanase